MKRIVPQPTRFFLAGKGKNSGKFPHMENIVFKNKRHRPFTFDGKD